LQQQTHEVAGLAVLPAEEKEAAELAVLAEPSVLAWLAHYRLRSLKPVAALSTRIRHKSARRV
jgi:hypothetical protein